ncbi:MAG TPA: hypothetical protein VG347_04955, partial [Verrucomicrobiae bacterium]|nr:hypothetical protein [Verrucomicrobiae bacterium]
AATLPPQFAHQKNRTPAERLAKPAVKNRGCKDDLSRRAGVAAYQRIINIKRYTHGQQCGLPTLPATRLSSVRSA